MAAKTLSTNPLVITSADTWATVPLSEAKVKITGFYWDPGTAGADGDDVVVAHANGDRIWSATLRTGDLGERSFSASAMIEAKGLAITPPDHGTLYIYLADSYA